MNISKNSIIAKSREIKIGNVLSSKTVSEKTKNKIIHKMNEKEDNIKKYKKFVEYQLSVNISYFAISVIDESPQELLLLSFNGICFNYILYDKKSKKDNIILNVNIYR